MRGSNSTDERVRRNVSFLAGLAFLAKFAIWTPAALNPALTLLIAACIFGPGVISVFQSGKAEKNEDSETEQERIDRFIRRREREDSTHE